MKEKIINLIEEVLMVPPGTITEATKISDVEAWDSLAHVMIIGELESKLGVVIPLDEAIQISSVKDIINRAE